MHIAVRTDLLALTKNTNTLVTDKMYDTTGRKKPFLFSLPKLSPQREKGLCIIWCANGLTVARPVGVSRTKVLPQKMRPTVRGVFLCLAKSLKPNKQPTWNRVAKWALWWVFNEELKHVQRMIAQICGPYRYAIYPKFPNSWKMGWEMRELAWSLELQLGARARERPRG